MDENRQMTEEEKSMEDSSEIREESGEKEGSCIYVELSELLIHFIFAQAKELSQVCTDTGVTLTNVDMTHLGLIWENPGITAGELSRRIGIHKSSSSRTVTNLMSWGFVEARIDEQDNRRRMLYITEQGAEVAREVVRQWVSFIRGTFSGLNADEMDELTALLRKMNLPAWSQYGFYDAARLLGEENDNGDKI